jgi:BON domain
MRPGKTVAVPIAPAGGTRHAEKESTMKRVLYVTLVCAGLIGGCEDPNAPPPPSAEKTPSQPIQPGDARAPMPPVRDADLTAALRRALEQDPSTSTAAATCTITTANGVATLKGVVSDQAEKDAMEKIARAVPGVVRVDNQIEVKAP